MKNEKDNKILENNALELATTRDPFLVPPSADNAQNTAVIFEERKFYRDELFKSFVFGEDNLIDYWNESNFYGRVNKRGMPIVCNEGYLKAITSVKAGSNPLAMNFVADAFDDLSNKMGKLFQSSRGYVDQNSILFPLEATNAWVSGRQKYAEWLSTHFDVFVNSYLKTRIEVAQQIVDFPTFLNVLLEYLEGTLHQVPMTFSSFILSRWCPMASNGLIIDVYDGNSAVDRSKFNDFLTDSNFEIYRRLAKQHGFFVDKNIPWRLVANLNHPYMLQKQKLNGFFGNKNNLDQIFRFGYSAAHQEDIEMLKIHFAGFYQSYVETFPSYAKPRIQECNGFNISKTIKVERKTLKGAFLRNDQLNKNSDYYQKYGDMFWLRVYYYLKVNEFANVSFSLKDIDSRMKKYYDIYRVRGFYAAVEAMGALTSAESVLKEIRFKADDNNLYGGT
tara:strand:- start:902 stop:2242 length:1341 start_codon:yes stop_codon:yes gene_type:complete